MIEEKQIGAYEGGRPPILLSIRADGVHVMGVDLTMTHISVVIINFKAELKASGTIPTKKAYYCPEEIVEMIAQGIQSCMWGSNLAKDQIAGVGIGIPGPVDSFAGIIRFLPNYGWQEVPFCQMLKDKINHPVFIENSSNNLAVAEYWHGSAKGMDNLIVVTLAAGVGAGIILNGELIRGHYGIAGEFGHTCFDPDGPSCSCGRKGCIEAYVGLNAVIREARTLAAKGGWFSSEISPDDIRFEDVLTELEYGNERLRAFYAKAGSILGVGVHNLITLLNPEMVIITGNGVKAGDFLFTPTFDTIKNLKTKKIDYSQTRIIIKEWNDNDWVYGSGTLVLHEIYKSPAAG